MSVGGQDWELFAVCVCGGGGHVRRRVNLLLSCLISVQFFLVFAPRSLFLLLNEVTAPYEHR